MEFQDSLPRVLVIDDDSSWVNQVPFILADECEVNGYTSIDQALLAMENEFFDLVLLDLNFNGDSRDGIDVFRKIHALDRGADVIVISGESNPTKLVELFNAGVSQFIMKPAHPEEVRSAVRKTLEKREIQLRAIRSTTQNHGPVLIGKSKTMQRLRNEITNIVKSGTKDILLQGETGTGKELVARLIAFQMDRSCRFIPIHCGAISDGLIESELFGHTRGAFTGADRDKIGAFEAAGGGFVFLDEIGDMPLHQQAKLLRVLQERKVQRVGSHEERDVRFRAITATHVDLELAMVGKRFREDLYYRIARTKLSLPSLRERPEDIPELIQTFFVSTSEYREKTLTAEALALLQAHDWPGNVRQLLSVTERLANRCSGNVIREKDVCQALPELASVFTSRVTKSLVGQLGTKLLATERRRFEKALVQADGDRNRAAGILGISRATFFRKAKQLGLVRTRRDRIYPRPSVF